MVEFSYWAIVGLIYIADEYWNEIDGACARVGVDPLALPFDRFLRAVYSWAVEHTVDSENGKEALDEALFGTDAQRLGREPDNVAPEVVDEEMALFRSASATLNSGI
jgi:hypothetical protein